MNRYFLYLVVFFTGGVILGLEILGTRILGPFYGVSIFLWSSLIGITLLSLSAGYFWGGKWADKEPKISKLCYVIAAAGIWILLIPILKEFVLNIAEHAGLRFAVLVSSFILFAPPLTLLGIVSPYAVKSTSENLDTVGSIVGNLYAVSTIGSVLSALLTGFVLIPNIGVNRLIFIFGLILLLISSVGLFEHFQKIKKVFTAAIFLIIVLCGYKLTSNEDIDLSKGIIYIRQSPYAEIRIVDFDGYRHMLIDGSIHTIEDTIRWKSHFPYVAVLNMVEYYFKRPGKMLLIGLGGGSVAKSYSSFGWSVDAVEIDPVVYEMAKKYFYLQDKDANVHLQDGRDFIQKSNDKYDLVVFDAFGSSSIPFHLITSETFRAASRIMNEGSILAINIETDGWHDVIVNSIAASLKESFKNVIVLPIAEPPNELGNLIILASNRKLQLECELERDYNDPDFRFSDIYYQAHAEDNQFVPDTEEVSPITDDLNKSDIWSERISRKVRQKLHKYFKEEKVW